MSLRTQGHLWADANLTAIWFYEGSCHGLHNYVDEVPHHVAGGRPILPDRNQRRLNRGQMSRIRS